MRTYPLLDTDGQIYAFEVSNTFISGATIGRLMRGKLGATITSKPTTVLSRTDVRVGFAFKGVEFIVVEPYGDNSRYWVGLESGGGVRNPLIDQVHTVIIEYRPTPMGWLRSFRGHRRVA